MANKQNKEKVVTALKNKNLVKIISGIQNYDKQKTLGIATAAEVGGATAIDICDSPEIIKLVRALVQIPIFVSSVDPLKLVSAESLGADVLEIGNYESFYKKGEMFTGKQILEIAKFVKKSITTDILLCCTIPSTLEIENQIKLAKELIELGVDILQTEGFIQDAPESDRTDTVFTDILKASSTLANTINIRQALPYANIITASGITNNTAQFAIASGASGVGVGTYVNTLNSQTQMTEQVRKIVGSVNEMLSFSILQSTLKTELSAIS